MPSIRTSKCAVPQVSILNSIFSGHTKNHKVYVYYVRIITWVLIQTRIQHMCNMCHPLCLYFVNLYFLPTLGHRCSKTETTLLSTCPIFTYWHVLGCFKNLNLIKLSYKATYSEDIDKINKVVLYGISENMAALVKTRNTVPLIKQIKIKWATMWLNTFHNPT